MGVGQIKKSNKVEEGCATTNIMASRLMHFDEGNKLKNNL